MNDDVARTRSKDIPLCVDLDGTLVRTDMLWESVLANARLRPWILLTLPLLLLKGRASMKSILAESADIDVATLPYRTEVLELIRRSRRDGREIFLATASSQHVASKIADAVGLFDGVIASDDKSNLKGARKANALVMRFGRQGFDYIGDSAADRPVWAAARRAFVVGPRAGRLNIGAGGPVIETLDSGHRRFATVGPAIRALRPHQWAKNLLVFVPLLAAHRAGDPTAVASSLLAFMAFCLCASSAYVLNDLLDLGADRAHPRKRERPFASGDLSLAFGMLFFPVLVAAAVCAAYPLETGFHKVLATYFVVTMRIPWC